MVLPEFRLEVQGFGRDDGVDAADFVADLPTDLEQVVRNQCFLSHYFFLTVFLRAGLAYTGTGAASLFSVRAKSWSTRMLKSLSAFM